MSFLVGLQVVKERWTWGLLEHKKGLCGLQRNPYLLVREQREEEKEAKLKLQFQPVEASS